MASTPFRSANPAPILAVVFGLVSFGLGSSLVTKPELVLPLTFEALALGLLTFGLLLSERERPTRAWLVRLVAAALGIRLLALVVVHYFFPPYFFALDSWGYERIGAALSLHWQGLGPEPRITGDPTIPGYYHLNAVFHVVFGDPAMGVIVLNVYAGVWTALLVFKLARESLGTEVAKTAAFLTAFFPSLILWSVLNVRDALAMFAVTLTVLFGLRTFRAPRPDNLLVLGAALILLTALRDYMAFLCLSGLVVATVAAVRRGNIVPSLVGGTILVLFLSVVAHRLDLFPTEVLEDPFQSASQMRASLQTGATSAFGVGARTETMGATLRYLPVGFTYLLLAPFPWAVETPLQAAAVPETLIWYPILVLALVGMRQGLRGGRSPAVFPLAVLIVVATSYAIVEGNFGTAYRHRAQIMPLGFIFAGVGLQMLKPWVQRWRRPQRRRSAAGSGGAGPVRGLPLRSPTAGRRR